MPRDARRRRSISWATPPIHTASETPPFITRATRTSVGCLMIKDRSAAGGPRHPSRGRRDEGRSVWIVPDDGSAGAAGQPVHVEDDDGARLVPDPATLLE